MNLEKILVKGGTLSYSAGSAELDPLKFRYVEDSNAKIGAAITLFPEIAKFLTKTPVVINCYPATLGYFESVVYIDTYQRPINFSRGLMLAEQLNTACIIMGQPLCVTHLLLEHYKNHPDIALPKQILFALGGYYLPESLEQAMRKLIDKSSPEFLHAYGMAEVDYACLLGTSRNKSGQILYKVVNENIRVELINGYLHLKLLAENHLFNTGDYASWENNRLIIYPGSKRMSTYVKNLLKRWRNEDWYRRTGYIARHKGKLRIQLRAGVEPKYDNEVEFYLFCRNYNMSWAEKPAWSI